MHVPLLQQQPSQLAHRDTHTHMMIGPPSISPFFLFGVFIVRLVCEFLLLRLIESEVVVLGISLHEAHETIPLTRGLHHICRLDAGRLSVSELGHNINLHERERERESE